MGVSSVSGGASAFGAVAAGLRGQMKAENMKTALEIGGLADPGLVKALDAVQQRSRAIVAGGLEVARAEISGRIIDLPG